MTTTIKTVLHVYEFDTRTEEGKAGYAALVEQLQGYPHKMHAAGDYAGELYRDIAGPVELETSHLFNNQWNTAGERGVRVFDWAEQAESSSPVRGYFVRYGIKRGHYLEQTAEMREIRANTAACGYCGKQEPLAKGYTFCPHCIDSEYLKEEDLYMTRMMPVEFDGKRAPLTEAESANLLPQFRHAQIHGATEQGKARIAAERAKIERDYKATCENAKIEHDAFLWLLDNGISTKNAIYYDHTGRFCFGWRKPLSEGELSILLDVISEFPGDYDIKCADGRKLSN